MYEMYLLYFKKTVLDLMLYGKPYLINNCLKFILEHV